MGTHRDKATAGRWLYAAGVHDGDALTTIARLMFAVAFLLMAIYYRLGGA